MLDPFLRFGANKGIVDRGQRIKSRRFREKLASLCRVALAAVS